MPTDEKKPKSRPLTEIVQDLKEESRQYSSKRAPISDEELRNWAQLRADDAGHLARELIGYRDAQKKDEIGPDSAPSWYSADEANAWASGYNKALEKK